MSTPAVTRMLLDGTEVTIRDERPGARFHNEQGHITGCSLLSTGKRVYYVLLTTGERVSCFREELVETEA